MTAPDPDRVRAAAAVVYRPPGAPRIETDEFLVLRYPDWWEHPLQLVRFAPRRPLGVVLDEVAARSAELGDRLCCWVRGGAPDGLAALLVDRGARPDEVLDVLAAEIGPSLDLDPPPDLTLRWSDDLAAFADAMRVGAAVFGSTAPDGATIAAEHPGERAKVRSGGGGAVVAYRDGRALGSGGLTVADGAARLWGGAVLPEERGRGVYRAVLSARLGYAAEHGADLALVKGRVESSAPILRRAGFTAYEQERSYLLPLQGTAG